MFRTKRRPFVFDVSSYLVIICFAACILSPGAGFAKPKKSYVKDGKTYGVVKGSFRHRWWNYYERGLSFADGGFFEEVKSDLMVALRKRKKDQRMARTYGMHFVDYFPNRELGVVHFKLGDLEAAKHDLETSLAQFPTAKALYYLDEVRKALLKEQGGPASAPDINLDVDADAIWSREEKITISGTVRDPSFVADVRINNVPIPMTGSQNTIEFRKSLTLPDGEHLVRVNAANLSGKASQRTIRIHVDRRGPVIRIEDVQRKGTGTQERIEVMGSAFDMAGVARIEGDGSELPMERGTEVFFSWRVPATVSEVTISAVDRVGNRTDAKVYVDELLSPTRALKKKRWGSGPLLAFNPSEEVTVVAAARSGSGNAGPPSVTIEGWTDSQTVYLEKVFIQGQAKDDGQIVALAVNREPVLKRKGKQVFFNAFIDLEKGKNQLLVDAEDNEGNTASEVIDITREVPKALQLAERLSMTVMPFEQKGLVSDVSVGFQDYLLDALSDRDRFRLIEREQLDDILKEQKLSQTELIDRKTAIRLGKLAAARTILTGSIIQTQTGTEIVARLIDTETSELLSTQDVYDEVTRLSDVKGLAEALAVNIHGDFPLLDGVIVQQKGGAIFTDLGLGKVKLKRRLIVFREAPIVHPVTGKVLGADNHILGHARITQVTPGLCKAEFSDKPKEPVKVMDRVITE